jgi:SAM-dependent methyltransferase
MSWNSGYVTDVAYVSGYYAQQSPAHLAVACLLGNVATDIVESFEALSYLELGCGRGFGALVLAASNPGWQVTGIDFNPAHIAEARLFAAAAGLTNVTFLEADLSTLAESSAAAAIPQADVVSMHGLWSWVAEPVQQGVVRLLAAKLRAGGVLHISYNALPGWQGGLGLQRLLFEAGSRVPGRSDRQVGAGLEVVRALHAAEGRHLTIVGDMIARLDKMPVEYLAHEYMNAGWRPCFHADVAAALAPARLDWVAAADLLENFPTLMLTEAQRAVADRFEDPLMRELVKDLCNPRSLRHDVFVRGPRRISNAERDAALRELTLTLKLRPEEFVFEALLPAGKVNLEPGFYRPVVAALGQAPMRVAELLALPELEGHRNNPAELVGMLLGTGQATILARPGVPAQETARRFNHAAARAVLRSGRTEGGSAMASVRLGAGLACLPVEHLVLDMLFEQADSDPVGWALAAGMTAESATQFRGVSDTFMERRLPLWRMAGVC